MTLLLVGLGALGLLLPGMRPSLSLRGDPRWFVPLDTASLALGVGTTAAGLLLAVATGALHVVTGSPLLRYGGHVAPGGLAGSLLAGVVLVWCARRSLRAAQHAARSRRTARADSWLGQHHDRGDHELVVLPTSAPVAYSVEGSPPQVVISHGLQDRLERELVEFVIDHERAHLRRQHRHGLLLATCIEATISWRPVIRSTTALRLAIERTADEEAAGGDATRRRHIAAAMRRLAHASWAPLDGSESASYRARQLGSPVGPRRSRVELVAAAGLAALALLATAVLGHAGSDLPTIAMQLG